MRSDYLEALVRVDQFSQHLRQANLLADHVLHGIDAVDAQVEPQLE